MRLPRTVDFNFSSDRLNILMLFFLALIVRLIALGIIHLISRDSIKFLAFAKYYFSGLFLKVSERHILDLQEMLKVDEQD